MFVAEEDVELTDRFELRHYEAIRREAMASAIGNVALQAARESELQDLRTRRRTEVISTLAEGLKPEELRSAIDTHYRFNLVDGKLVAEDGEAIENMLLRALREDIKLASRDPFFAQFLVARSRNELDELREIEAMARNETQHNGILTISPYSEEYDDGSKQAHQKLARANQKPYWKRAMVRFSYWSGSELHLFTYSVDNSSIELLQEAVRRQTGYEFIATDSTGTQGERISMKVDDSSMRSVASGVGDEADRILSERHGGVWKQGNPEHIVRQSQKYVESQGQIVDHLLAIDEQLSLSHQSFEAKEAYFNDKLYDCIALLEKRLEFNIEDGVIDYEAAASGAGVVARSEGKSYDACGMIISSGENSSQATTAGKTGFESLKRLENKKIACPECKEKVVVPQSELSKGILCCVECGYTLDVCTGKKSFKERVGGVAKKAFEPFEIIKNWWTNQKREKEITNMAEAQALAEIGDQITYSDKKHYEKRVRRQLQWAA